MILTRQRLVVPDGTGPLLPQAVTMYFPAGSDVEAPYQVVHADGSVYVLTGAVAGILAFKERDSDKDPKLQLTWTITNAVLGQVEFSVVRGDILTIPEGRYAIGVQFRDDDVGFEDQVTGQNSRATVGPRIADFDEPITVQPTQLPLAQGPPGLTKVRAIVGVDLALSGVPAAQDGVALAAGDDVLLVAQGDEVENGAWTISAGAWDRMASHASAAHAAATQYGATEGSHRGGEIWHCVTKAPADVIDADPLSFEQLGCELPIEVFTVALRPSPGAGGESPAEPRMILNRTSNQVEISDGTNWYSPDGDIV